MVKGRESVNPYKRKIAELNAAKLREMYEVWHENDVKYGRKKNAQPRQPLKNKNGDIIKSYK